MLVKQNTPKNRTRIKYVQGVIKTLIGEYRKTLNSVTVKSAT